MSSLEILMLLHGFLATIILMAASLLAGVLLFAKDLTDRNVTILKWGSLGATAATFLLNLTGVIPYMTYRLGVPTSPRSIILASNSSWAHEVAFESMEYIAVIGPVIAVAITYMLWHYKSDIVAQPTVKRALVLLLAVAVLWGMAIVTAGVIPSRIAAVR